MNVHNNLSETILIYIDTRIVRLRIDDIYSIQIKPDNYLEVILYSLKDTKYYKLNDIIIKYNEEIIFNYDYYDIAEDINKLKNKLLEIIK